MAVNAIQRSALSRLFSSTVVREMAARGRSGTFVRLMRDADLIPSCVDDMSVGDVFEVAFGLLKRRGLRDEYIYKAALTHRILMGRHSLRTASKIGRASCRERV